MVCDCSYLNDAEKLNAELAEHQEKIKDFDDLILADDDIVGLSFFANEQDFDEIGDGIGSESTDEIIEYIEQQLWKVAKTQFTVEIIEEFADRFKRLYVQVDHLAYFKELLKDMKSGSEKCANRVFDKLKDLNMMMAFSSPDVVDSVRSHIVNSLSSLAYDYVIPLMKPELEKTLNTYIANHIQEYVEKMSVPGADMQECFKELMSGLSIQMRTTFESEWKKDIMERNPKTSFEQMLQDMIRDIRYKAGQATPQQNEANLITPQSAVTTGITPAMLDTLPDVPTTEVRVSPSSSPLISESATRVAVLAEQCCFVFLTNIETYFIFIDSESLLERIFSREMSFFCKYY